MRLPKSSGSPPRINPPLARLRRVSHWVSVTLITLIVAGVGLYAFAFFALFGGSKRGPEGGKPLHFNFSVENAREVKEFSIGSHDVVITVLPEQFPYGETGNVTIDIASAGQEAINLTGFYDYDMPWGDEAPLYYRWQKRDADRKRDLLLRVNGYPSTYYWIGSVSGTLQQDVPWEKP